VGEMRRAIDREIQDQRKRDRFASTLVIAAAIIAAVRLAREDIRPTFAKAVISCCRQRGTGKDDSGAGCEVTSGLRSLAQGAF